MKIKVRYGVYNENRGEVYIDYFRYYQVECEEGEHARFIRLDTEEDFEPGEDEDYFSVNWDTEAPLAALYIPTVTRFLHKRDSVYYRRVSVHVDDEETWGKWKSRRDKTDQRLRQAAQKGISLWESY